ncbi:hypothetical protein HU830_05515 [Lactobacillus sp. DCY120]|uniref:Uncharacterized protein n=1 Tax=Bombilactobacillus apium TaxID=2675299 RepID=A0A850R0M3_9LACO|nr:hypothetical protein [Bombilactobacillus apium]NVY96619.1 hypothetical protein [Bombilactobacillus apium]
MLISYLTEKQKSEILQLAWHYSIMRGLKYYIFFYDIMIVAVVAWEIRDYPRLTWFYIFMGTVCIVFEIWYYGFYTKSYYRQHTLERSDLVDQDFALAFLDCSPSTQENYSQLVRQSRKLQRQYKMQEQPLPGTAEYKITDDRIFQKRFIKDNIFQGAHAYKMIISTQDYYILAQDDHSENFFQRRINRLTIIAKTAENIAILDKYPNFNNSLKSVTNHYFRVDI